MLSYMVPVEDKSPPHNLKLDLNLVHSDTVNQNDNAAVATTSPSAKIINFERQHYTQPIKSAVKAEHTRQTQRPKTLVNRVNDMDANVTGDGGFGDGANSVAGSILANSSAASSDDGGKKLKIGKIGNTKNVALKR